MNRIAQLVLVGTEDELGGNLKQATLIIMGAWFADQQNIGSCLYSNTPLLAEA